MQIRIDAKIPTLTINWLHKKLLCSVLMENMRRTTVYQNPWFSYFRVNSQSWIQYQFRTWWYQNSHWCIQCHDELTIITASPTIPTQREQETQKCRESFVDSNSATFYFMTAFKTLKSQKFYKHSVRIHILTFYSFRNLNILSSFPSYNRKSLPWFLISF